MVDDDLARRRIFTKRVADETYAQFPDYNIVVCNVGYGLGGTGGSLIHKTSYHAKLGSNVSFDVIIFKGPNTFRRNGDGGYENWAYKIAASCYIDGGWIECS